MLSGGKMSDKPWLIAAALLITAGLSACGSASQNDHAYDDFFAWEPCLAGETILIGSIDTVRDQIQRLVTESGINYFVGSFAWGSLSPEESHRPLDLFTSRIAPQIH